MKYLTRRDEQKRLYELRAYITDKTYQDYTDGYSYLGAREQMKKEGFLMGLDIPMKAFSKYLARNGITPRKWLELEIQSME